MRYAVLIIIALIVSAATAPENGLTFRIPEGWPAPEYDFSTNPLSESKAKLGRQLFFDPLLSADSTVSCANCHSPYNAFAHTDHAVSHGIHDRFGTRNAPALQNLAWQKRFMWDGAIHHLDQQALAPISNPDEMGEDITNVVVKLNRSASYRKQFQEAFGKGPVTGENTLKAISQFLLTLVSSNSRYDSVQQHLTDFTAQEANGERLFMKNCNRCHTAPLFTNNAFENNGLALDTSFNDTGRQKITGNPDDNRKFKVPSLRNIAYTAPYMHDGRFRKLRQVLDHYTDGVNGGPTLSEKMSPKITLGSDDKTDIIAFLMTLSDRKFLFDPEHSNPVQFLTGSANR